MYILCEDLIHCFASEMRRPCQTNDVSLALQLTFHSGQLIVFRSAVTIETLSCVPFFSFEFLSQLSWT